MTQTSTSESSTIPTVQAPASPLRCVLLSVCVTLIGCLLLACAELAMVAVIVVRQIGIEAIPVWLLGAALGRIVLTHLIIWTPMMVVASLCCAARRRTASPAPMLLAIFILLAGLVVVPADLGLANRASALFVLPGCAAVLAFSGGAWLVLRRWVSSARLDRVTIVLGSVAGVATLLTIAVLARSPLRSADAWRAATSATRAAPRTQPNVLWIVLDTARADRMSVYGNAVPTTPFLEDFAENALVCDAAIANGMWTVPSHAAMFTGLSNREHGVDHRNLRLDSETPTVAKILAGKGYATGFFSNNPLLPVARLDQGFADVNVMYQLRRLTQFSISYLHELWGITPLVPWLDGDYGAAITNAMIADWLDRQADQPVFLFVNYMEAHLPYKTPRRYREMFMGEEQVDRSYDLRRRVYGNLLTRLDLDYNIEDQTFVSEADADVLRRQYDATIRYLDDRVRELVGLFVRRGMLDNTVVVITSDHGEHLGGHGMWGHRFLTYQDLTHVAMMIREPGRRGAARIEEPVQLSDLFSTVLNATGSDSSESARPNSRDLLADGAADRIAIVECNGPAPQTVKRFVSVGNTEIQHRKTQQIAALDGRYKLIQSADGHRELYDLSIDPGELNNLFEAHPDIAARLSTLIQDWRERTPRYVPSEAALQSLTPEAIEALKSLGYLGDE